MNEHITRLERFAADHAVSILIALAVLMLAAGGISMWLLRGQQSDTQDQVDVLRPQVTNIYRQASVCGAKTLSDARASRDCARRLRIALINCRRYAPCRAALAAALARPPEEVIAQNPSSAGQQPSPGAEPGDRGDRGGSAIEGGKQHAPGGTGAEPTPKTSPSPAAPPAEEPAAGGPPPPAEADPADETPAGLEACVEVVVGVCVEVGR